MGYYWEKGLLDPILTNISETLTTRRASGSGSGVVVSSSKELTQACPLSEEVALYGSQELSENFEAFTRLTLI